MKQALISLCAVGILCAGCGGDEDTLTAEQFLEQGNAICEAANAEINAAIEGFDDAGPTAEQVIAVVEETIVPSVRGQLEDLRELNPPEDMADAVGALLDDAEAALAGLERDFDEDPRAFIASDVDPFAEVNAKAGDLGLTACAEGG